MQTINTTKTWQEITWTGSSLFIQNQGNYKVEVFLGDTPTTFGTILGSQNSKFREKEMVVSENIKVWVRSVGLVASPSKLVYHAAT